MAHLRWQDKLRARWRPWRLPVYGFLVGFVAGPFLSAALGLQVTTAALHDAVRQAVVREQAAMCELLARRNAEDLAGLDVEARIELAERHARFPWVDEVNTEVVNRCSNGLARGLDARAPQDSA